MTIKLHQGCKNRLREILTPILSEAKLQNGLFLDRSSILELPKCDEALPNTGRVQEELLSYIDEYPFFNFIYERLSAELYENGQYKNEAGGMLKDVPQFGDPSALASRLIEEFSSLPWIYTLTFSLPASLWELLPPDFPEFALSDSVKLVRVSKEFTQEYPQQSGIQARDELIHGRGGLLSSLEDPEWPERGVNVQIYARGMVGTYGKTAPVLRAEATLKTLLGLCLALWLIKPQNSYSQAPFKRHFYVHRCFEGKWMIESKSELDVPLSEGLSQLRIFDGNGEWSDTSRTAWIQLHLYLLKACFSDEEKASRVYLASQWLFESHFGHNELLSFIQATVCLEILLGDKATSDEIGLGTLLRNRCAYLIGTSHTEREEILTEFSQIYNIRSQIVHAGKSRLSNRERAMLKKLRWMCDRVIQEELRLISKTEHRIQATKPK